MTLQEWFMRDTHNREFEITVSGGGVRLELRPFKGLFRSTHCDTLEECIERMAKSLEE
jgi:hypothetical protein